MIKKEKKFDLVMKALEKLCEKHKTSIDDILGISSPTEPSFPINWNNLEAKYLALRHELTEIVQVFKEREVEPTDTEEDELLPLKTGIKLEQLKMDFKELLSAFAFENEAPLPVRESNNFKFLMERYGLA